MRRILFCSVLIVAALQQPAQGQLKDLLNKGKDLAVLGGDIAKGIAEKAPDYIPSVGDVVDFSKQTFAGLPFQAALSAFNQVCAIVLAANATTPDRTPNATDLNYVLLTPTENVSIPITDSVKLWKHPSFNPKFDTVVLITGWTTDINDTNTAVDLLSEAYAARGNTNFVFIDTARYVDSLYTWSAFNTKKLGEEIGKGLALLAELVASEKIHIIGHSLGAHISGAAGQSFQTASNGKLIKRITGLDPANPCFKEGETLTGLMRGDAEFVDIIHTNNGVLGKRDPIGDADFYPNGIVPLQPGCLSITCSHARAYELFAETVKPGNEAKFPTWKCSSLGSLDAGACRGMQPVQVGFNCPHNVKGNYFFKTTSEKPFAL